MDDPPKLLLPVVNGVAQVFADGAVALVQSRTARSANGALVLVAASLGACLVFANGALLPVTLAAISRALSLSSRQLQWLVNADVLPLAALTMAAGALGDRFGRRRVFLLGILVFGVAGAAAMKAPNWSTLFAARLAQGVGAAFIIPNSLAILGQTFPSEARARAVGIWSAAAAVGSAAAPAAAGVILQHASWRAALLLPIPLAGVTLLAAGLWTPRDKPNDTVVVDLGGAALSSVVLAALGAGLTRLTAGAAAPAPTVLLLALAFLALIGLILVERRRGDNAMLPPALLSSPTMIGANLFTALLYGPFTVVLTLIPFVMIRATSLSTTAAGLAFAPLQFLITMISPLAGLLCRRVGRRPPLFIGGFLTAAGCLAGLRIGAQATYWRDIFPAILLISIGMSVALAPLTTLVLTSADPGRAGAASGMNSAMSRVGSLIAVALLGQVLAQTGQSLIASFRAALVVSATSAVLAGVAVLWVKPGPHVDWIPPD